MHWSEMMRPQKPKLQSGLGLSQSTASRPLCWKVHWSDMMRPLTLRLVVTRGWCLLPVWLEGSEVGLSENR